MIERKSRTVHLHGCSCGHLCKLSEDKLAPTGDGDYAVVCWPVYVPSSALSVRVNLGRFKCAGLI